MSCDGLTSFLQASSRGPSLFWTISQIGGGFDQVFGDPALGDEVHDGEKQERLVLCMMVGDRWVTVPPSVGPKISEHLEVFLKHCLSALTRWFFDSLNPSDDSARSLLTDPSRLEKLYDFTLSLFLSLGERRKTVLPFDVRFCISLQKKSDGLDIVGPDRVVQRRVPILGSHGIDVEVVLQ